mgnify:CR=1 FL=1
MSTPHNRAEKGDFAKTVLMPGDPLRAKFIAETFLENPRLVTDVRGMYGFTGTYQGRPISVMGSGMGMPSIGIYSHELIHFYGVKNLIRVGSCGATQENAKLGTILMAQGACTDSNYAHQYQLPGTFSAIADFTLLKTAQEMAEAEGYPYIVGNILSSDAFYGMELPHGKSWQEMGVLAVEMEAAALYTNAAAAGANALAILTISDGPDEVTTAEERQTTFTQMMEVALSLA